MLRFPRWLRWIGSALLWAVVALCLTVTVLPHFLDRIYYRGPVTDHFDGQHFFNPDGDDDRLKLTSGGGSRLAFMLRQATGADGRPAWPKSVRVKPSKPAERVTGDAMTVTWVGHATLLVQADGLNILTDPVWSTSAGPFGYGPTRVAEPGIAFDDLPKIDIVLVSHNHYDHMDVGTLKKLWERDHPLIVTSLGNDAVMRSAGIEAKAFDWGGSTSIGVQDGGPQFASECANDTRWCLTRAVVHVTRNHHWDSRWFTDRNRALWSSFVVELPSGNVFFSGDTGLGDGKWPAEAAAFGPIRFAAIPIGAFRFEEGQMASGSHIGPGDALKVWNGLGRPFAVPIHWGTFRLSWEGYRTPPDMLAAMEQCAGVAPGRFSPGAIGVPIQVPALGAAPPAADMGKVEACYQRGDFKRFR